MQAKRTEMNKRKQAGRGQASVEFLLTIILVAVAIVWVFELVMLIYSYNVFADAAKEGVRYAVVHGSGNSASSGPLSGSASDCTTNVTAVKAVVLNYAKYSFHDVSGAAVTVCYLDGTNQPPNRVRVTVSYPFIPFTNLGWNPPTIRAAAEGRIVY